MNAVIVLVALSAVTGLALRSLSWFALGAFGVMLAALSSATLHVQGFSALPGIAIVVACLTVNQIAYMAGVLASQSRPMQSTKADANHLGDEHDRRDGHLSNKPTTYTHMGNLNGPRFARH